MCEDGVAALIGGFDLRKHRAEDWEPICDGFGEPKCRRRDAASKRVFEPCPECGRPVAIVKRLLDTNAYELPDAAIYQRLRWDHPCIALGEVRFEAVPGRTAHTDPCTAPETSMRSRWQGMLWHTYQVAFIDVRVDGLGQFCPTECWQSGARLADLSAIRMYLAGVLEEQKEMNRAAVGGSSWLGEEVVRSALGRELQTRYGFAEETRKREVGFWCAFLPDGRYERTGGDSLGLEVKVTDNWRQPLNQSLKNLLHRNGTLGVRLVHGEDRRDEGTRALVSEGENRLEITGRAAFLYVR